MSAADLLSNPSTWISRAPAAASPEGASKVPSGLGVVVGLFRPATALPATPSPRSRMSFMITFGFASTR
jgi:hypothetical protein